MKTLAIIGLLLTCLAVVGLLDEPPQEYCDGDACYINGWVVDEHGNYTGETRNDLF